MEPELLYNVSEKWDKDRIGTMRSAVLDSVIEVATPPEFERGVVGFGRQNIYWLLLLTVA